MRGDEGGRSAPRVCISLTVAHRVDESRATDHDSASSGGSAIITWLRVLSKSAPCALAAAVHMGLAPCTMNRESCGLIARVRGS